MSFITTTGVLAAKAANASLQVFHENPATQRAYERALLNSKEIMPSTTKRNYGAKIREWNAWCLKSEDDYGQIPDGWRPTAVPVPNTSLPGNLVDPGKVVRFMTEEVIHRAPKKGKRVTQKRKRDAQTTTQMPAKPSKTVKMSSGVVVAGSSSAPALEPVPAKADDGPDGVSKFDPNDYDDDDNNDNEDVTDLTECDHQLKLEYNSVRGMQCSPLSSL